MKHMPWKQVKIMQIRSDSFVQLQSSENLSAKEETEFMELFIIAKTVADTETAWQL